MLNQVCSPGVSAFPERSTFPFLSDVGYAYGHLTGSALSVLSSALVLFQAGYSVHSSSWRFRLTC